MDLEKQGYNRSEQVSELMKIGNTLPSKIEDLAKFVLIGREQLNMVRAGIKALDKLDMAKDVREQKKAEAQMLAEALMDAEVRIGEILLAMPKAQGANNRFVIKKVELPIAEENYSAPQPQPKPIETKQEAAQKLGFNKQQVERFQTLAQHKDIVEQVKQEARANDDLATRTAVLQAVKYKQVEEKKEERIEKIIESRIDANISENIKNGNCLEILETLQNGCIDIILTDPPYGINYVSNRSIYDDTITKRGLLNDGKEEAFELLDKACEILQRKTAENAHLYFFCSWSVFSRFESIIAKYFTIKTPIVWDKGNKGSGDLENDWGNQTEIIIYCVKGKKLVNNRRGNIINVSRLHTSRMVHPTQKPDELIRQILEVSATAGDFVVDPFMGSGSTIKVCNDMKFKSLGIELDQDMFNIANQYINE
jgi:DNA modification methylase